MPWKRIAALLAVLSMAHAAAAQTVDARSDLGQFRKYRDAGMQALDWNDPKAAYANFDRAGDLIPDSPSILLLKARAALKGGSQDLALEDISDYLARGYVVDMKQTPELKAIWNSDLAARQAANQAVRGSLHIAASLPGLTVPDALAFQPEGQQLYIATVRNGRIIVMDATGGHDIIALRPGVAAYGLGLHDGLIWAATAATRQTEGYVPGKAIASKIITVNPQDGPQDGKVAVVAEGGADSQFGHLLAGRDDLYVVDTNHGAVLRLQGYRGSLQTLVPEGYMDSPQGLAENSDASVLMVSDFISGLYRIDLATGRMTHLKAPPGVSLLGLTALARYGHDLVAVQNGFKPNKILHLHMKDDWSAVTAADIVLRDDSQMSQPAQGVVDGDHFIFVSRSQWDNLDPGGAAISDKPAPATIGVVELTP